MVKNESYIKMCERPKKIICNCCGKEYTYDYMRGHNIKSHLFKHFDLKFDNYDSQFDGQEWQIDLCDKCIGKLVKLLKIKPEGYEEVEDYNELKCQLYNG